MGDVKKPAVRLSGVKKKYKLGQITSGTLQGDIKEWIERRRERKAAAASGKKDRAPEEIAAPDPRLKGNTFMALNGIDLTIGQGEAIGIIGRNGAGKSTLLKLLSRITTPSEGTIDLYGRVASMLEVGTGFNGEMTGRENIYMNGAILGMTKAEIDAKMDQIIEFSEVEDFIDTPVKRYSSGMYVKLGFAVAAHLDSEIIIMDEVLAVGDMAFQKKCLDKMRDAASNEGRTVIYVSHNMNTIRRLCERCVVLEDGVIVYDGDVEGAIAIYLGGQDAMGVSYEFSDAYRPFDSYIRMDKSFNMLRMRLMDEEAPYYDSGSKLTMRVTCRSLKAVTDVAFRAELWSQDDTKTGAMATEEKLDFPAGESCVEIALDLTHLTPGQYRCDLIAYTVSEGSEETILDGVYPCVRFEINKPELKPGELMWRHQYWGHIRLHDMSAEIVR